MEETRNGCEKTEQGTHAVWIRPTVKELDIKDITLQGFSGQGSDNSYYS